MKSARLFEVILAPHVSEKTTTRMEHHNEYVFWVVPNANKTEIKDAIEHVFNTKVKTVRTVNLNPKKRMFRNVEGKKGGGKKAYVTLQQDQKLDIFGT